MLDEGIVLLGCSLGEWLEPVCVVCHAILVSPLLDALCYCVSDRTVESSAVVDNINEFLIDITWKILVHFCTVEYVLSEILRRTLYWCHHVEGSFPESLCYNLKS